MVHMNVWELSLKVTIVVANMMHYPRKPREIWMLGHKFLKLCILLFPKRTPSIDVGAHLFFLTFQVL